MKWRLAACTLEATVPFCVLVAFLLFADTSGAAGACLVAALLHECGHLWALRGCGCRALALRLTAFGAEIQHPGALSYTGELWANAAGPLANLSLCALSLAGLALWPWAAWLRLFAAANLGLALFNLLPVEALDGGQCLLALLSRWLPRERALFWVRLCSLLALLPLATAGFLLLLRSRWNFTLLAAALGLLLVLLCKPAHSF